ncbi:hypothetical protein SADO_08687 [Salinisphaera dokdonensis CL-ES53]|uniref:DUF2254 domain-containing protein n=1 Tax=Salinisphaera dokdonensis CL-ES53 TaxID=1304272 RepID=A0ABV2B0A4_9GAMM
MAQLIKYWNTLKGSYWFIPTVMSIMAALLSFALTAIDSRIGAAWVTNIPWIYSIQAEGARGLLTTVAGSMIGVAGVTFSITIAALSYTTSTLGPRLLTNFMHDRGNQITLGTFVSTFVYCLLLLRVVQAGHEGSAAFVPHLSLLFAVGMAVASLAVLIYFIHHITESLHVSNVVANVASELDGAIDEYQRRVEADRDKPPANLPADFAEQAVAVRADGDGYIQNLIFGSLVRQAATHDLVLRIERSPGDFVAAGQTLLWAWPAARVDDDVTSGLIDAYAWGRQRTQSQDVFFLVNELVEIAARALSPGINDPYTAMGCLDWLSVAINRVARDDISSRHGFDSDDKLRVWARGFDFAALVSAVFDQLRAYFAGDRNAAVHMFKRIGDSGEFLRNADQRKLMQAQAEALYEAAGEAMTSALDRTAVEQAYRRALRLLAQRNAV